MVTLVLRDALRQYARRPLATAATVALQACALALAWAPPPLQLAGSLLALPAALLLELFLIAYLAEALANPGAGVPEALATTRRALLPGLLAYLLIFGYLAIAALVGMLLLGDRLGDVTDERSQRLLTLGLTPLFAVALAFLAVLRQRVVLGGERRVMLAAAAAHRVASNHFPLCLLVGLLQAVNLNLLSLPLGQLALAALALATAALTPLTTALGNALYLRTAELHPPAGAASQDPDRPRR